MRALIQRSCLLPILLLAGVGVISAASGAGRIPIVYSTDLYQPHVDPDDHFDLATLFAIEEFDILGIVLDDGDRQQQSPGRVPVGQMIRLTGRNVPAAIGLRGPLKSPDDKAYDQPDEMQGGVQLILDALNSSNEKVIIFATGSLRDVAVAFNREPELLQQKVRRLYINIGSTRPGEREYNVGLEPTAYQCVLRSGLPVYWCPCFGSPYGTYWHFRQGDVLDDAAPALHNFFIFALTTGSSWKQRPPAGTDDPIGFLFGSVEPPVRARIWEAQRNMWCTAPFFHAAGREVVELEPRRWVALRPEKHQHRAVHLYDFVPGRVTIDDKAHTSFEPADGHQQAAVQAFRVVDERRYQEIMTSCLRELLHRMDVAEK